MGLGFRPDGGSATRTASHGVAAPDAVNLSGLTDDAERLAFARFYLDVLASGEPETPLPQPHEIADVLQIARA